MKRISRLLFLTFLVAVVSVGSSFTPEEERTVLVSASAQSTDYIKYIDFTPTSKALNDCMKADIDSYGKSDHVSWVTLLSLLSTQNYGNFSSYKSSDLDSLLKIISEQGIDAAVKNQKLYNYYLEAYEAVLGGLVGEYNELIESEDGSVKLTERYGLRAFSPIASGYSYVDYDDFGSSRSYGYKRSHLGHDLLGSVGTPVIAVESGYIVHLGWNMYGGWRIGIRSFDGKRYYYYAHLRAGHPYAADMYEGRTVNAGEVIGYLGMTGYSSKENTNGIDTPHLHYGLQIIFDVSQIDGPNQIWCDMYELTRFLSQNRAKTYSDGSDRYSRIQYLYPDIPD